MKTKWLGAGEDVGDLATGDWRLQWGLNGCGIEVTLETGNLR